MALTRVQIPSPNYSSRGSASVRLIVIHTAEGATSIESLGNFFKNPSSQVSSHTGIDDTPNTVGEYVQRPNKAWTAANANAVAIQTELCAFASWSASEWQKHSTMLQNCAKWIAEEAAFYKIPLKRLSASQAQGSSAGICGHADLGSWGGGHWDPGPNFPMDQVIQMAQGSAPAPPLKKEEITDMIASTSTGKGYWTTTRNGAVYAFGDAQYKGGANQFKPPFSGTIVGIAGASNDGYWLLADDGGVFSFGNVQFYGRPDRV